MHEPSTIFALVASDFLLLGAILQTISAVDSIKAPEGRTSKEIWRDWVEAFGWAGVGVGSLCAAIASLIAYNGH